MSRTETGLDVLYAEVGPVRLVLPVGAVEGVDLEDEVPSVDGHAAFGIAGPAIDPRRIRLRGRGRFDLVVGGRVRVVHLGADGVEPLPAFLAGLQGRMGLVGLARVGDQFALFLDPSALEPT